jgi:carbon-monoxide dehydrogenase medium subunit
LKPAPFDYHRPETLGEALDLLAELGTEARPLAGGQSLIPFMNFRLARPSALVDLNRVEGLTGIDVEDGSLTVGAMTRQWDLEHSPSAGSQCPILPAALRWVGHTATRARGTVGGSLSHADPAAELPVVAVALAAEMNVAGSGEQMRSVPAGEFFADHYTTTLAPGELLAGVRFPTQPPSSGWGFEEFAFRSGDFAIASAAVTLDSANGDGILATVALGGVASTPIRAREAERVLSEEEPTESTWRAAGEAAASEIDPIDDEIPAGYRRQIVANVVEAACRKASQRRGGGPND